MNRDRVAETTARLERRATAQTREAQAMADIRATGHAPDSCGPEIPHAPARTALQAFQPVEMVPGSTLRRRNAGYLGRDAARIGDVWDLMTDQARRAHAGSKHRDRAFAPPFTAGQVATARSYAALTERVAASGVRCSAVEALRAATPGGGGDWIDAVIADTNRLAVLHRRIGDGPAREIRRLRPGDKRRAIRLRVLVDQTCLGNLPLDAVLRAHGWETGAKVRNALRAALCGALDRMQGYSGDILQDMP